MGNKKNVALSYKLLPKEIFGFTRAGVDVHTMGILAASNLLRDCGYRTIVCDSMVAEAVGGIGNWDNASRVKAWILDNNISRIGFSYRLDPMDGQGIFGGLMYFLRANRLFYENGGPIKGVYFAGLPEACLRIKREYGDSVEVFTGNEDLSESLRKLGVPSERIPKDLIEGSAYDERRMNFARDVISREEYKGQKPIGHSDYALYGTFKDRVVDRIESARRRNELPLIRVHVGPYNSNYLEAKAEFNSWLKKLGQTGYLDIVSIGTSQLTQSNFGEDWGKKPNGGGVPVNSIQDYKDIWSAARPMLVRTYAGTKNILELAKIYEESINIAWHALSFWWFCLIDGRGPNTVRQNLEEQLETLKYIAQTGKPYEPNIPHHFAFRGGDDVSYVLSGVVAAKVAKLLGIKYLILQTMLNTPKYTWGIQDLAKSRALLKLVREMEDEKYRIFLQPRTGIEYFSPDIDTAKCQLAAVTALMDDIEPLNQQSPEIIHVVSYSEAVHLATPEIIDDSIKITLHALKEYRRLRENDKVENMEFQKDVRERTAALYYEVKEVLSLIEKNIRRPYTPEGLYEIFRAGFFSVPHLSEGREEFQNAVRWKTAIIKGSVKVIDDFGEPISATKRAMWAVNNIRN